MNAKVGTLHLFAGAAFRQSLPVPASSEPVVTNAAPSYDDDPVWNALFAQSQEMLAHMADEALAEFLAGKTEPLDPDTL